MLIGLNSRLLTKNCLYIKIVYSINSLASCILILSPLNSTIKNLTRSIIVLVVIVLCTAIYSGLADGDLTISLPDLGTIRAHLLKLETFDQQDAWEEYSNLNGVELGVENGVYRAYTMNEGYVWGLNEQQHNDVVLEVEVTPLSIHPAENGFGIMCRADTSNNGDGYYFMINGSGYYSIMMGQGDGMVTLVDWQQSNVINQDIDRNVIRAVCVDNYLALYVNGQLLVDITDNTYAEGYAGLSVAASGNVDADIAFDNLALYEVVQ